MREPIAIDLFCGLGGWTEGLLATGWRVIGFDIERHEYGDKRYPAELVLQDVLTIDGRQFAGADLIVASPPCTEFSYMAMPWTRAKQIRRALLGQDEFPDPYTGSRTRGQLTALFDACFRIQREACEAAGQHIPLIVENVRGAQEWVGPSKYNFGSYHLWGDIPALMPRTPSKRLKYATSAAPRLWKDRDVPRLNDRAYKSQGLNWSDRTKRGQDFTRVAGRQAVDRCKVPSAEDGRRTDPGKGNRFTSRDCGEEGLKFGGGWWHDSTNNLIRKASSRSQARKQASAEIAKIPFPLARWIGKVFLPEPAERMSA